MNNFTDQNIFIDFVQALIQRIFISPERKSMFNKTHDIQEFYRFHFRNPTISTEAKRLKRILKKYLTYIMLV